MLTHKPDCTKPVEYPVVGRYGDPLVRCRCCHAFAVADAPTRPVEPSAAPKPAQKRKRTLGDIMNALVKRIFG